MIVSPAPHARGLNSFGPRFDVVLRGMKYLNYNPNPAARGPLSPVKTFAVNNVHTVTQTADKLVYHVTSKDKTERLRVHASTGIDAVYINGQRLSFGGTLADFLDLIDNRSATAWQNKQ